MSRAQATRGPAPPWPLLDRRGCSRSLAPPGRPAAPSCGAARQLQCEVRGEINTTIQLLPHCPSLHSLQSDEWGGGWLVITSPPPPSTHCIIDTIALTADRGPLILLQNITCCVSKHNISDISVLQTLSPPLPGVTCYPIRARSLKGPQSGKSTKIVLNARFENIREYLKCKTGLVFA